MPGSDTERRILVVQTAFLGDVVLTTPLFRALKRIFPRCSLSALVTPQAAPLIEEDPYLDGILTYDKKGKESFWSVVGRVRRGGYDLLLAPHRSHRTALLAYLSRVPVRVGFADAGFSTLYQHRVARPLEKHEVDRTLALVHGLGAEPSPADRALHVGYTEAERRDMEDVLRASNVGPEQSLVALSPGSVWATKRWSPEGFAAVGRRLTEQGHRVVLLGGPDDREVSRAVAEGIGSRVVDATGRTRLKTLAAWMDRVRLLVTNDSAPLHVAAARGTPTVAIFGATTRELGFYPFHRASRVVEVDLDCRPCGLHGGDRCPETHFRCMGEISSDMVLAACDEVLGEDQRA